MRSLNFGSPLSGTHTVEDKKLQRRDRVVIVNMGSAARFELMTSIFQGRSRQVEVCILSLQASYFQQRHHAEPKRRQIAYRMVQVAHWI